MRLTKLCPNCNVLVHVRKSVCECGHCFLLKRKASSNANSPRKSKRIAIQCKRASESAFQTTLRRTNDTVRKAQKRALETEHESILRKEQDKIRNAKKRALETDDESVLRKEQDKIRNAKKRALEGEHESMLRKQDKARIASKRATTIYYSR